MKKRRKIEDPNPLNFYGIRQLRVPSPHFECIDIDFGGYNFEASVIAWINENLKSRFYVGTVTKLDDTNSVKRVFRIGFEDPKELSFFTLACPLLKYK